MTIATVGSKGTSKHKFCTLRVPYANFPGLSQSRSLGRLSRGRYQHYSRTRNFLTKSTSVLERTLSSSETRLPRQSRTRAIDSYAEPWDLDCKGKRKGEGGAGNIPNSNDPVVNVDYNL